MIHSDPEILSCVNFGFTQSATKIQSSTMTTHLCSFFWCFVIHWLDSEKMKENSFSLSNPCSLTPSVCLSETKERAGELKSILPRILWGRIFLDYWQLACRYVCVLNWHKASCQLTPWQNWKGSRKTGGVSPRILFMFFVKNLLNMFVLG